MSELLRELEEDIKRDRAARLWKRWGGVLIGASLAVVIGTAAGVAWKHQRTAKQQEATGLLLATFAKQDLNDEGRISALAQVAEQAQGQTASAIAQLQRASLLTEANKGKEAFDVYVSVAKDTTQDKALRNLAAVLAVNASVQYALPMPELADISKDEAFYAAWQEAKGWKLLQDEKREEATARFASIRDDVTAPALTRNRMQTILASLGEHTAPAAADKKDE